jgi:hypothetical protein
MRREKPATIIYTTTKQLLSVYLLISLKFLYSIDYVHAALKKYIISHTITIVAKSNNLSFIIGFLTKIIDSKIVKRLLQKLKYLKCLFTFLSTGLSSGSAKEYMR